MDSIDGFLQELRETPKGRQFLSVKRANLFKQLHEIVFYGKGGYDWETVYHLPLWLRRFVYSEINKAYKAEADAVEQAKSGKSQTISKAANKDGKVRVPDFVVGKPRK